ncbi:hypothetical protein SEA_BILLNYE_185 [Streptomyces phage BillNye]|uniref:Uncharacterized protein n=2 Tax=Wilnyevirus billnye TaxID=2560486 RepID=A0A2L1IW12_9CAUD|nr:hypothetical protein FDJ30_gp076 [Streptomyces phage BillNye]AVD99357.1 hypothetical protein SEA_BILLNYE_185 [Streptomyces phage BillNye]QBZ72440.1 hypothetical protein SEA_CIRCINUS_186 [Streptomyces phage Circinus]
MGRKPQAGGTMSHVEIRLTKDMAMRVRNLFDCLNEDMRAIAADIDKQLKRMWDEGHDQEALCLCGHSYYRHFDSWEGMEPIGCKYCECDTFEE